MSKDKESSPSNSEELIKNLKTLLEKSKKLKISKPDRKGEEENKNFSNLEPRTQDLVNTANELIAESEKIEAENFIQSIRIKSKILKFLDRILIIFAVLFTLNIALLLIVALTFQIRLYYSSFSISNSRLFDILTDFYLHSKFTFIAPVALLLVILGGWLFKKAGLSNGKKSNSSKDELIDKINDM